MYRNISNRVIQEVSSVLNKIDPDEVDRLVTAISTAKRVIACGAGRMGMMVRAFTMRLKHLNIEAYHINDCNTPRIGKDDLLIASSGSGETKSILILVEIAKKQGANIALVTTRAESSMGHLADLKVVLPAPSKEEDGKGVFSIQPMTTLTEQATLLFYDTVSLLLMERLKQTHAMLKERHSVLE